MFLDKEGKFVWIGIYLVWLLVIDAFPEVVKQKYFLLPDGPGNGFF